jgi:hypothetical protein
MTGTATHPARRTSSRAAAALLGLLVPGSILVSGCANGETTAGSGTPAPTSPLESAVDLPTATPSGDGSTPACGQVFAPPAGTAAELTGQFPTSARIGDGTLTGTVELTAPASVRAVITPAADAFLVRHGRVVTMPVPQDLSGRRLLLSAGQVQKVPAVAALTPCDPGATTLTPGTYQLYARVVLNDDDGTGRAVVGGPWTVEVR